MRKLVRDKIPDIIRADGKTPILETCSEEEFLPMLITKLKEEIEELAKVVQFDKDETIDELADIYEVLIQICLQIGSSPVQVAQHQNKKQNQRGGFYNRVIWNGNMDEVKILSEVEQEILKEAFLDTYAESQYVNQEMADKLRDTLLEGKAIYIAV